LKGRKTLVKLRERDSRAADGNNFECPARAVKVLQIAAHPLRKRLIISIDVDKVEIIPYVS
jgi:hypothetical protein